ncbi:MAG TPA: hypothetical protein VML55_01400, partial [Planctomycetaceae bacterium]|nr:hypothetical protein [Planctomycetaceae bacterium]
MMDAGRDRPPDGEPWDPFEEPPDDADADPEAEGTPDDEPWMLEEDVPAPVSEPSDEIGTYTLKLPERPETIDRGPPGAAAPDSTVSGSSGHAAGEVDGETRPERSRARPRRRKRKRRRDRTQPRPVPAVSLRSALAYPLEGAGLGVLAMYAVLLGFSRLVPVVGPLLAVVVLVYMALLFLETASATLDGVPGGPRFPSLDLADVQAALFGVAVMVIGILPYVAGRSIVARLGGASPVWELLFWPLPMYYLPMAFLVLADSGTERGLDPRLVVGAIGKVGGVYFVLVTLAAAAFLVPSVTLTLLELSPLLLEPINGFLLMYLMAALLRAVGILYLRKGIVWDAPLAGP